MDVTIRNEEPKDYRRVEEITREAFWNLYVPGCDEHYLVHVLRDHEDFLPELNFVILVEDELIGNIMYTRSKLMSGQGRKLDTLTFGPVCIHPDYQRKGYGSKLIRRSIEEAKQIGEKAVIILGHPSNYVKYGFRNCADLTVMDTEGRYPFGQLVLELDSGVLAGNHWTFTHSPVYEVDQENAKEFDMGFPEKEKKWEPSQEEFSIASRAYLESLPSESH